MISPLGNLKFWAGAGAAAFILSASFHRYIAFGESVSLEDRLALQAQIASLEADRQSTKVNLLAMKQKAKAVRAFGFRSAIEQKLAAINMQHLVEEALAEAHAEMLRQGFGDAYKQNL